MDSTLKHINGTATSNHADLSEALVSSPAEAADLLDGFCTLMYLFITASRKACEASGKDVLAETVPFVVGTQRAMTTGVAPEAVPVMAAMMTAAAMGLSPSLWRASYGPWREELMARERTILILAQEINSAYGTDDAALRMVMDSLAAADDDSAV